jgi:hypothetical protein
MQKDRVYPPCDMNNINRDKKALSPKQPEELLRASNARFEKNLNRHNGLEWVNVKAKLEANPEKLWSLNEMERTGGEPDVVGYDQKTSEYIFFDCSPESPKGRTSLCYDREALALALAPRRSANSKRGLQ